MNDVSFMRRAIDLARPGTTFPNPAVGCVLTKAGRILAEGATGEGGRPHAEEVALDRAGLEAEGATAYVSLEPCGARSAGGLSCSERLIAAKVARVVFAAYDPSPFANHLGPLKLRAAHIGVEGGFLSDEADFLIAPNRHFYATGLPLIRLCGSGHGCDAPLDLTPDQDIVTALKVLAAKGYRQLWLSFDDPLAVELKRLKLAFEPDAL